MGEIVVLRPHDLDAAARQVRGEGRGRLEAAVQPQTMELLRPAPYMRPLEARELGQVWELAWFDFPAGGVRGAIDAIGAALPAREQLYPVAGVWSVEVGFALDRVYLLTPFRDWDHRHELKDALKHNEPWPPKLPVPAIAGGSKLLLPTGASGLK